MDGNEKINSDGRQACYIVLVPTSTGTCVVAIISCSTILSHHVNKKLQVHTSYQYKYNELCMIDALLHNNNNPSTVQLWLLLPKHILLINIIKDILKPIIKID